MEIIHAVIVQRGAAISYRARADYIFLAALLRASFAAPLRQAV